MALHAPARAENFPIESITIMPLLAAGTGLDVTVRLYAEQCRRLRQAGGGREQAGSAGLAGVAALKAAPADGYTMIVATSAVMAIRPTLLKSVPYDALKDFVPIALYVKSPFILVVDPTLPIHSVPELIKYVKERPGQLSYSSSGVGGAPHLSAEYMKQRFDIDLAHVPYRNSPQSIADVAAGHVAMAFAEAGASLPLIRDGKLRALAVTSSTRLPTVPELPPFGEAVGAPDFEAVSWHVLLAPAGTPQDVVDKLHAEMKRIMEAPDMRRRSPTSGSFRWISPRSRPAAATSGPRAKSGAVWSASSDWKRRNEPLTPRPNRPHSAPLGTHRNAMAKPQSVQEKREDKRPTPRLYLVTPVIEDAAAFSGTLRDALAAADVARRAASAQARGRARPDQPHQDPGAAWCRSKDIALVLDGQPRSSPAPAPMARTWHGIEAFMAAVDSLKPARIAGCGGLNSRDDAMLAGERGADYVMIGEVSAGQRRPSFDAIVERDRMVGGAVRSPLRRICRNARRRSASLSPPAPISSRSATTSGTIRAASRPLSPRRQACSRRSRCDEFKSRIVAAVIGAFARDASRSPQCQYRGGAGSGLCGIPARPLPHRLHAKPTRRVDEKNDPKAMTLLGELYADGLGVPNDDKKAAEWYKLAAARGDREAVFALAMFG